MQEIWKEVEFFGTCFSVSSFGRVRKLWWTTKTGKKSKCSGRVLKTFVNDRGYECARVSYRDENGKKKSKRPTIHRLVCTAFYPNPENKPQVNHKDGNQLNNHKDNLEWATAKENTAHAWKTGLCKSKIQLKAEEIEFIKENYVKMSGAGLANFFGVSIGSIHKIAKKNGIDVKKSLFKRIIDTSNGIIYLGVNDAAEKTGIPKSSLRKMLSKERPNKTTLRYIDRNDNIIEPFKHLEKVKLKPLSKICAYSDDLSKEFDYIFDCANFVKTTTTRIKQFLEGKCSNVKGFKFKLIDDNGNFIEPIPFVPKRVKIEKKKRGNPILPKKIERYTESMVYIDTFNSLRDAAIVVGSKKETLKRMIKQSPRNYAKGFIWKIID